MFDWPHTRAALKRLRLAIVDLFDAIGEQRRVRKLRRFGGMQINDFDDFRPNPNFRPTPPTTPAPQPQADKQP